MIGDTSQTKHIPYNLTYISNLKKKKIDLRENRLVITRDHVRDFRVGWVKQMMVKR